LLDNDDRGYPREGVTFVIDARLREREDKDAAVQIEQQTRELRERWTLALGSEKDWVVVARTNATLSAMSRQSRPPIVIIGCNRRSHDGSAPELRFCIWHARCAGHADRIGYQTGYPEKQI
jgi:hypothetical protein